MQAEVADADEAIGQDMEEKAAGKFFGIEGHRFQPVFVSSVPVAKSDLAVLDVEDAVVGEDHTVRVAAEVVKDRLWGPERANKCLLTPFLLLSDRCEARG